MCTTAFTSALYPCAQVNNSEMTESEGRGGTIIISLQVFLEEGTSPPQAHLPTQNVAISPRRAQHCPHLSSHPFSYRIPLLETSVPWPRSQLGELGDSPKQCQLISFRKLTL